MLLVYLIVITEPYQGLDYSKPNTYIIYNKCEKDCVEVIEAEKEESSKEEDEEDDMQLSSTDILYYYPWLQ